MPEGRRLAQAVIAFWNAALCAGRAGRWVVDVGGVPPFAGGVPPAPAPGGAPPVGSVTPFFFRQAVYLASAALETAVAPAPAAVVVVVEPLVAVVEVVLEAEPLLPPAAA